MKRPPSISGTAGAAAAQAPAQRRGARAVGKRGEADQTVAEKIPRREAAGFTDIQSRRPPKLSRRQSSLPSASMPRQPRRRAAPPLAPIGRRERAQLSRGRKEIDARLDLHGMTQTRAHRALSEFLQRAHIDGLTFVLVITGKGSAARRFRARGVAPPGAAMAEPAGISQPGGRFRGGAYRPWRRGRALCADQARPMMQIRTAGRFRPAG